MKRGVGEALRTRLDERDAADGATDGALGLTRILGARYVPPLFNNHSQEVGRLARFFFSHKSNL